MTITSPNRPRGRLARIIGMVGLGVLALVFTGVVYQVVATERDRRVMPAPGQLVEVSGRQQHIQCSGQGSPTVVLETGLGAWSSHWAIIQPAVAEHSRVCSYDRAGLGWSAAGPAPRDARQLATELHALLQQAGIRGPYVLAGHSNGGLYTRMFTSVVEGATHTGLASNPEHAHFVTAAIIQVVDAARSGLPVGRE